MTAAPARPARSLDLIIACLLFAGLATIYYATTSGITSSNDGSHYALLRTMVENRAFTLNQFDDYAEGNDIALTPDGRLFSDRPPGTALAAAPLYALAGILPEPFAHLPSRHDPGSPRLVYVMLLPALAGAATAVTLYGLLRAGGVRPGAALTAVVFFGLGTIQWKYSTVLFSHVLSGFLVILSVALALWLAERPGRHWAWFVLLGFVLGAAVVVEYSNALVVLIVGGYWLIRAWPEGRRRPVATLLALAAGGAVPALFLAAYNTLNFGGPLTLSYAYAVNYPWAGSFGTTFNFPLLPGLRALLLGGEGGGWCGGPCLNQGLFLLSPVLLVALPGFVAYYRRRPSWFWLTTAIFLAYLLLFARHHTSHGFTGDGRYLAPFLGLLVLPLGFALDWLLRPGRTPAGQAGRAALALLVYGLFYLSLLNQFLHIGRSYNYDLDLGALTMPLTGPQNWPVVLGSVFRNTANLPLLWLGLAVGLLLVFALGRRVPLPR